MIVDINGFKYDHHDGCRIQYRETSDYMNSKYPVRVLEVEIPYVDVHNILHVERAEKNGQKMYDINLLVKPLDNQAFQNKPFVDGKFKAILRDGDVDNDLTDSLQDDNRFTQKEDKTYQVPLVFYLYRDEELTYNQTNLNLVVNNPTLSQLWVSGFHMSNPSLKAIVSKFDHNPSLGMIVLPPMDYGSFMDYIENEFGLYETDVMEFIEHGVYFLLNKSNKVNVTCAKLEYKVNVYVARKAADRTDRFVTKVSDNNYDVTVSASDVSFVVENAKSFGSTKKYISPSGANVTNDKGLSRKCDLVYKTTNIPHINKLKNTVYEKCKITLTDNSLSFLTPLSEITVNNSGGIRNKYRLSMKRLKLVAGQSCECVLECFRLIQQP